MLTARNAWCVDKHVAAATYGPIEKWNVSQIKDLSYIFCVSSHDQAADCHVSCETFDDDVDSWDTSAVTTLRSAFYNARSFNQPLGTWAVSSVATFVVCRALASALSVVPCARGVGGAPV